MPSRFKQYISTLALCLCCLAGIASAQTITGNIGGTVTDPNGAVIPGARITATNVDTNVSVSTVSNSTGSYSIRFLQIGRYKIVVDAKGFSKNVYGPYTLEIDQIARIDAKLAIGSDSTVVDVSGTVAPILNTDNSQVDAVFDQNTIENIPLPGENFSSIMQYMPGGVSTQPSGFNGIGATERNTGASGIVSVNGNRLQTNNYIWDGVEINETITNVIGYTPAPDAIQEIKVVTANPNAEYGNASGGDVIMTMKSGTNKFHGSLFGHLQNELLNANTWSNKHVTPGSGFTPRGVYTQSQYGATLGGPLLHNKLFFFADYSAGRTHAADPQQLYLATAKMRTGDFSELLDPNFVCNTGDTVAVCNNEKVQLYNPNNNFAPYAGNLNIPVINPVAKYLYAHPEVYPEPNHVADSGCPTCENFVGTTRNFNKYDQGDVRVDYTPGKKDRFYVHYTQAEGNDGATNPVGVFFQNGDKFPDKIFAVGNVHTFSNSVVNEFRAGFSHLRYEEGEPFDPTGEFGLHGNATVGICNACTQPYQGFAGQHVSVLNTPGNPAGNGNFIDNTFHYTEALTWSHGKHNSKFGVEAIRYQQNNFYPGNDGALGQMYYTGVYTSNPTASANPAFNSGGYSVADFVLDRVQEAAIGAVTGRTGQRQYRTAYYAQDDWRITPSLTLNIGARYEFQQPIYEVNNKTANINFANKTVEYAGSIPAGNTFVGATVCPTRACYNANHDNFMPRVGFAYSVTPTFVVRGGYGITTYLEGTGQNLRLTYNPPYQPSFDTGVLAAPSAPNNPGVFRTAEQGFNSATIVGQGIGGNFNAYSPNLKPAFIGTYSLSTQYQVNNKSSLTISYVGESGQHLIQAVWANQLTQPCVIGGIFQPDPTTAACAAADPAPLQNIVGQGGTVRETASEAMSNYNALQASYRQRAIAGLEYTINYTYARAMSNSSGFFGDTNINGPSPYAENAYNNHAEYAPVGQDVRNNINGTAVYSLPYGHGRQFGGNSPFILDEILGGWKLGLTAVAYTGFPVTPYSNSNHAGTQNNNNRPNMYRKLVITNGHNVTHWFGQDPSAIACQTNPGADNGTCAFGTAGNGQYGTAAPNSLRGPGYQNYDASLSKQFTIYHEQKLGLTVEAYNFLNHASLGNPDSTVQDGTFGRISDTRSVERHLQISGHYTF